MLCNWNFLQGAHFCWYTDHKALIHLIQQHNLSGRQACWLEKLSEFDFDITYMPGSSNVVADALSHIYAEDHPRVVRAPSEFVSSYESEVPTRLHAMNLVSALVDIIAMADEPDLTLRTRRGTIRHVNVEQFTKRRPRKFIRVSAPVQNLEGASTHLDSPPTNQNNSNNSNNEQELIYRVENGGNDYYQG